MKRRAAIKHMLIVAGGAALLPSCIRHTQNTNTPVFEHVQLTAEELELIVGLVDTIIPETDTPGAKTLAVHWFVLKMIDDCHSPEEHLVFQEGVKQWDIRFRQIYGQHYITADPSQRISFIDSLHEQDDSDLVRFFEMIKRRTIQGYLNSEYVMKNELVYELVPGRYTGYASV